jgi:hypothetical protein
MAADRRNIAHHPPQKGRHMETHVLAGRRRGQAVTKSKRNSESIGSWPYRCS